MRVRPLMVLAAVLTPALTSCGVVVRSASSAPPAIPAERALTFAWNQQDDRIVGDPRLHGNRFFEDRLHEAIEWELSLRGIRHDETSPDLLVHHHLSLEDHELARQVVDESGYETTEVFTYEEGTVMLHILDAETRSNVWLAWAQADVEQALRGPENMRKWVYELAGQMFKRWPVPARRVDQ
jgi:hypothetical protein